jgi:hypothetical protein
VTAARPSHRATDPHNFHRPIWCSRRWLGCSIEYPRLRLICARDGPGQHTSKPLYAHVKPSFTVALDSGLFRRADIALVFLLLFAKALPLASSMMSLFRLAGWTHPIGKSACGGYRHDPPMRSAASEMVWTRFQLFYPEGPRCTRRSFAEQLIGCRHKCATFNLCAQNEFGAGNLACDCFMQLVKPAIPCASSAGSQ